MGRPKVWSSLEQKVVTGSQVQVQGEEDIADTSCRCQLKGRCRCRYKIRCRCQLKQRSQADECAS